MTYVGTYGGDDRVPVDRLLRRENHPLGVRRDEATKIATEEAEEAATSSKRWTFGAAAGALLVAGTMAAGALGLSGGATPVAGSAPEHAPASPGHNPGGSGPVVGAPAPGKDNAKPKDDPGNEPTTPASAGGPAAGAPVAPDTGTDQSGGSQGGGTAGGSSTETPAPAPQQPAPKQPAPAPAPPQQGGGGLGDVLTPVTDTVGDVLNPVTDVVGGILSPLSGGSSTASTQSAPAPSGPALTMINPLGDLLGG